MIATESAALSAFVGANFRIKAPKKKNLSQMDAWKRRLCVCGMKMFDSVSAQTLCVNMDRENC